MSDSISRRGFLKVVGAAASIQAVLTGCGPASRYVMRQPYSDMPEYTSAGKSTFFATTCGECPAGCGLIVRTVEGRAHKVEGNRNHPVSHGATCSRGQATLQGLYNPDRITAPGKQASRGSGKFEALDWDNAVGMVKQALQDNSLEQVGFLMGRFPDHLYDLARLIWRDSAADNLVRYGTLSEFEGQATLALASQRLFGEQRVPTFDIENAEMLFSFGANFVETWISPVAYAFGYGEMRQRHTGQRGYLVQFEPRMSQTAANADEWYPITPGSEGLLAQALSRLVAEIKIGSAPPALSQVDIAQAAAGTGVSERDIRRLAALFAGSLRPLALPGGIALGHSAGLAAAEAILGLNALAENLGASGGLSFLPQIELQTAGPPGAPDGFAGVLQLVEKMQAGQIKALLIHGINPLYELPESSGFAQALQQVPLVISFASFPDETALQADVILPDHTPLESWGYQRVGSGVSRSTVSGLQPVVVPLYNTRSTTDVILSALGELNGTAALPFNDEVDFLQKSVQGLAGQNGDFNASTAQEFWALWQQHGGWWKDQPDWQPASLTGTFDQLFEAIELPGSSPFYGEAAEYPLFLLPYPGPNLGDGSAANRPVLQEIPDPMTTVMWNSWVELNPQTAIKLGVKNDDVVKITSPTGEVEAVVYEYQGIHPDVAAIPLGQGHIAFGRYAQGRGINPLVLVASGENAAGNLATMATRVKITPTGKTRKLARYEGLDAGGSPGSLFGGS